MAMKRNMVSEIRHNTTQEWSISVPEHDHGLLHAWPDAWTSAGVSSLEGRPEVRVLSLMIHDRLEELHLDSLPALEAVVTRSDGFDHLPLEAMARRGIDVYHLEGYATQSVAHLAVGLLLMLTRRIHEATAATHAGQWTRDALVGRHLAECRVGIIGTGRIGTETARILDAMGVTTVGYDVDPGAAIDGLRHHSTVASLDALLEQCDAITLHVPAHASTKGLLDAQRLAQLPPGAIVVNTARGSLVDTDALVDALDGPLAGYGADVLQDEPHVPDLQRLCKRTDVVLTPHIAAHNQATIAQRYRLTRQIMDAVLAGDTASVDPYRVTTARSK